MSAAPRVSLLMSVFNGEAYLRPALDSVLGQSFPDFEFIVIDNGSTDGTTAILDSITDPRMVRLRNDQTKSITAALKQGFAVAKGDYVARLDADDIALPDRFAKQVAYLDAHPDVTLLASGWFDLLPDGRLVERAADANQTQEQLLQVLAYRNMLVHSTLMMRRAEVAALGDYPAEFLFAQDYALYLKLLKAGHRLAALPEPLVHLRHHIQQFSVRPETALLRADEEERLMIIAAGLTGVCAESRRRNRRGLASIRVRKGGALWRSGRKAGAVAAWAGALLADPTSCLSEGLSRLLRGR